MYGGISGCTAGNYAFGLNEQDELLRIPNSYTIVSYILDVIETMEVLTLGLPYQGLRKSSPV